MGREKGKKLSAQETFLDIAPFCEKWQISDPGWSATKNILGQPNAFFSFFYFNVVVGLAQKAKVLEK